MAQAGEVSPTAEDERPPPPSRRNSGLLTLIVPTKAAQYIASLPPENIYLTLVSRDYEPKPQTAIDPRRPAARPRTPRC